VDICVRVATIDDVAAIGEMLGDYEVLHPGRSLKASAAWRLTEAGSEAAVAIDDAGRVLGFGHTWRAGSAVRCFARVRPDATGRGVGTALLTHLERRARSFGPKVINVMQPATDNAGPGLLRALGYVELRHRVEMRMGLAGFRPPPAPPVALVPADLRLVGFDSDRDAGALLAAHRAVFPDDPDDDDQWRRERYRNPALPFDPALWFVARRGEEIVGFCLGFRRDWKGAPDGYVSDLGVRLARRGAGLGFALLTTVLAAFAARELPTATLDVDADNLTGALRLYRKAGMTAAPLATEWTKPLAG
jgi:mycothiol synthase